MWDLRQVNKPPVFYSIKQGVEVQDVEISLKFPLPWLSIFQSKILHKEKKHNYKQSATIQRQFKKTNKNKYETKKSLNTFQVFKKLY